MMMRSLGIACIGLVALTSASLAQSNFPNKPIKYVVGFAPGGPSDLISRVVGAKMGEILGTQMIIENKTGAGGVIAIDSVARAEPDGYTLLNAPLSVAVNETLQKSVRYSMGKEIASVGSQAETANVLVVHPSLGVKNLAELVALAKSKPGEVQYATAGRGSATHLNNEYFDMVAGIKTTPVHYRGGGDAAKDLLSGQVKMMFSSIAPVQQFVKEGKLLALATTGPKRDPAFPDVPTVAESGYPGFDVRLWMGVVTTGGTPKDVIRKLDDANRKAMESPDVQKTLAAQGFAPLIGSAEDFEKFYLSERDKWAKVVTSSGMDKN